MLFTLNNNYFLSSRRFSSYILVSVAPRLVIEIEIAYYKPKGIREVVIKAFISFCQVDVIVE